MTNLRIIPRLAAGGIKRNFNAYFPYLLATSICVAIFYIFVSIEQNPIMATLPHAGYVTVLMIIGEILLGIILLPFLVSVNSFLIKQRKNEIGLYSVLGLEKKHIGLMLAIESVILYAASVLIGIITAMVFSKLIFLFLIKITKLSLEATFTFSSTALIATLIYFGVIAAINLVSNLLQVSLANPSQLFHASKQGEKEPKHIFLTTLAGLAALIGGYVIALMSKMNSQVFTDFFFAVFLVIIGTYLLFKCGCITFLKACRRNKSFYYKSRNFVTVSGMLYRMKKNASGLSNICIFSTMTIITLLCTMSVFLGEKDAVDFNYKNDYYCYINKNDENISADYTADVEKLAAKHNMTLTRETEFSYIKFNAFIDGTDWLNETDRQIYADSVRAMTVDEYNRTQGTDVHLAENEILVYKSSKDYEPTTAVIGGITFNVADRPQSINFCSKNSRNIGNDRFYVVFANQEIIDTASSKYDSPEHIEAFIFNYEGKDEEGFVTSLNEMSSSANGFNSYDDKFSWERESYAMIGGLLFLGIFFGIVFIICTVLIMYYKQISEGYEDKRNFEIMQKVGMSDKEVRSTISKQILTVFFLPLAASVVHTAVAVNIVANLLSTMQIFNVPMILACAGVTIIVFAAIYAVSYIFTAKSYYKIVK